MTLDTTWLGWWTDADFIVRAVFITLIAMSIVTWAIVVLKLMQYGADENLEAKAKRLLGNGEHKLLSSLQSQAPTLRLQQAAWQLLDRRKVTASQLQERLNAVQGAIRSEQEQWLTILATIGSSAPFIGLLGTVWGIMHALQGLTGKALTLDAITGPVGEALVATSAGLFAAIPALIAYNFLLRWLRRINMQTSENSRSLVDHLSATDTEP